MNKIPVFDFNEDEFRNRFFENVIGITLRDQKPMDEEAKICTTM